LRIESISSSWKNSEFLGGMDSGSSDQMAASEFRRVWPPVDDTDEGMEGADSG
jgi:hypothetical protein